jgi:hypothetical protein
MKEELLKRMKNLLTSTTRTPYGYKNIWEWRKEVDSKINFLTKKINNESINTN